MISTDQITAASNGNGHIRLAVADLAAREQIPALLSRLELTIDLLARYGSMVEALASEVGEVELDLARRRESKRLRDARYRQRRRNRRAQEVKA